MHCIRIFIIFARKNVFIMKKKDQKEENIYLEDGIYDLGDTIVEVGCI